MTTPACGVFTGAESGDFGPCPDTFDALAEFASGFGLRMPYGFQYPNDMPGFEGRYFDIAYLIECVEFQRTYPIVSVSRILEL